MGFLLDFPFFICNLHISKGETSFDNQKTKVIMTNKEKREYLENCLNELSLLLFPFGDPKDPSELVSFKDIQEATERILKEQAPTYSGTVTMKETSKYRYRGTFEVIDVITSAIEGQNVYEINLKDTRYNYYDTTLIPESELEKIEIKLG